MIDEKKAVEILRSECTEIAPRWKDHIEFWGDDEAGFYNDAAVCAHYVVDQHKKNRVSDFPCIFNAVENIINIGTEEARGVIIVGFLEAIQNIASHKDYGATVFEKWLGITSRQAWVELNHLWSGKSSLADIIRSQKE